MKETWIEIEETMVEFFRGITSEKVRHKSQYSVREYTSKASELVHKFEKKKLFG